MKCSKIAELFLVIAGICAASGCGSPSSQSSSQSVPNPNPQIQSISPSTAAAGSNGFNLVVTGTNFVNSSVVTWNSSPRPTSFTSSSQLSATISGTDLAAIGSAQVTVVNPSPGGGQSGTTFSITAPNAPVLTSVSPLAVSLGTPGLMLTANGSNFTQSSTVQWNGSNKTTNYVSNTQLTAAVSTADLSGSTGNIPITVVTPAPGGGASTSVSILLQNPLPSITSLAPSSVVLGSGPFTLTVNGSNFVKGALVAWNNVTRVTQFVSPTQLTASILAPDTALGVGNTAAVTVQNPSPSAGISNSASFTLANPAPQISSVTPTSLLAGNRLNITINGSGFVNGATVQVAGQTFPTSSVNAGSVVVTTGSLPVGTFALTVTNPAPSAGPSNSLSITGTAAGPAGQLSVASLDPSGNIVNGPGVFSATGRFVGFQNYLRDTCIGAPAGCMPSTIQFRPPVNTNVNSCSPVENATSVSVDGRYVASEREVPCLINKFAEVDVSDTCLGATQACVPSTNPVLPSVYPAVLSMSLDGRYIAYSDGGTQSITVNVSVYDTCLGAPLGCTPMSIPVTSPAPLASHAAPGAPAISGDARFVAYTRQGGLGAQGPIPVEVVMHDTCLGAAPGCVVSETDMAANCAVDTNSMTRDAQYLAIVCGVPSGRQIFIQRTCVNLATTCPPAPSQITFNDISQLNSDINVSAAARFVAFDTKDSVINGETLAHTMVYVSDSCNGAATGCSTRTVPVCLNSDGAVANDDCLVTGISDDGQYLLVSTPATNLAANFTVPGEGVIAYLARNPLFP